MTTVDQMVADAMAKVQATKDKNIRIGNMPVSQPDLGALKLDAPTFSSTGKDWKNAQK
jgi:hypothetical protein